MFCTCQVRIDTTGIVVYLYQSFFRGQAEQKKQDQLDRARHEVLGSRDERTPEKIFFEQDPHVKKVKPPGRCYGIGEMVEQPCATEAPPAASKVYDGELNKHQLMQKRLLEVRHIQNTQMVSTHDFQALAGYALASFNNVVSDSVQEHLRNYHELINAPSVGCPDNYMWPSWQLNIAPAQACQHGECKLRYTSA